MLIVRQNRRFDRKLFLDAVKFYNDKVQKAVNIRIIGVEIDEVELKHGLCHFIKLYVEVRQANFKCKAYYMRDGAIDKNKTELVNASWETIGMRFKIDQYDTQRVNGDYLYKFETDHILFNLINDAFIRHKDVPKGNKQGIQNISKQDLKNALSQLDVKICVKEEYGKTKIMPVHGDLKEL